MLMPNRLSQYRVMWVFVLFDLPTETKKERHTAADFRKQLLADGFSMFQFSIYIRHCASMENASVHMRRVKSMLPQSGKVCTFCLTDRQFAAMEIFYGRKAHPSRTAPIQLELF